MSEKLTRRDAIARVSALFGGATLIGQAGLLTACSPDAETVEKVRVGEGLFSADEVALLDEIADTILPDTDTPGAKAADVGPFIAIMVTDTYYDDQQKTFRDGMATIDARASEAFGGDFLSLTPAQRLSLLEALDIEQYEYSRKHWDGPAHFFRMMKELTLLGYFTSEIGYTQALRYAETPGRYDPCAPYQPGDKAWADHA